MDALAHETVFRVCIRFRDDESEIRLIVHQTRLGKNLKYLHNSFIVIVTSQLRILIIVSFYGARARSKVI